MSKNHVFTKKSLQYTRLHDIIFLEILGFKFETLDTRPDMPNICMIILEVCYEKIFRNHYFRFIGVFELLL